MQNAKRILFVACGLFGLFSLLILQFFRVQIVQETKWQRFAKAQHELTIKEPFKRGVFYSNSSLTLDKNSKPQPFVVDIPVFHLYVDPFQIPTQKRKEILERLTQELKLTSEEQKATEYSLSLEKSRSRKVKMWLSQQSKSELSKWWFDFAKENKIAHNALYFVSDYKRCYPFGSHLGQILHTIREDKEEGTEQGIPTGGLEYFFNSILGGVAGKKKLLRSPKHPLDLGKVIEPPQHGADIYLTINHHLQAIAEEEVKKGVEFCQAKSGWAILMNPHTGEILAYAQYPFFSPADYRSYYNDEKKIEHTRLKGICDRFENGSVTKPLTMALCLLANEELQKQGQKKLFDPNEKVPCLSGRFPGRDRDLVDPRPHAYLNLYQAIQKTSNIYPARIVERVIQALGPTWYRSKMAEVLGFGEKTGVEYPMETEGLLPTPGRLNSNGTLEWSTPTPFSLAIGYNFMVNSLHILRVYAAFANEGHLVQPTFVRKIVKTNDEASEVLLDHTDPKRSKEFKQIFSSELCRVIRDSLLHCVSGGGGYLADIYGYTVAGKTGTARKIVEGGYSQRYYFSSFVGFAPATDPKLVLLVSMDEPSTELKHGIGYMYYGGKCAAPVFREIMRRSLQYLGVKPDNPHHYPPGDPRHNPKEAYWYKPSKDLKELYEKWNLKR